MFRLLCLATLVVPGLAACLPAGPARAGVRIGPHVGYSYFPSTEGRVGDQPDIVTAFAEAFTPHYGLTAEWQSGRGYGAGVSLLRTRQDIRQTYRSADELRPTAVQGHLTGTFLDVYGILNPFRGWNVGVGGGLTYAYDEFEAGSEYEYGPGQDIRRTYSGTQANAGVSADWSLTNHVSLRFTWDISTSFTQPNADTRLGWRTSLMYQY